MPALNSFRLDWAETLMREQEKDAYCQSKIKEMNQSLSSPFVLLDGILYKFNTECWYGEEPYLMVVPQSLVGEVLHRCHCDMSGGHMGWYKTWKRVARSYYWVNIKSDVSQFVKGCSTCQRMKPINHKVQGLLHTREPQVPGEVWCIDLCGPMPITSKKNRFVLVCRDLYSRWNEIFPLKTAEAAPISRMLKVGLEGGPELPKQR
jgi:hypothetical protein